MELSKISPALFYLVALALLQSTHAQDSPQDYLNAHNAARAAVGVGPLKWNATEEAYAQSYAKLPIHILVTAIWCILRAGRTVKTSPIAAAVPSWAQMP